jgi:enoyl-CoA hydratase/carnithine racemase
MTEPTVRFHTDALRHDDGLLGIATLDRPQALNALDHRMIRELLEVLARVEADPDIRGLWIESSAAKAFCAGGDVRDVTHQGQRGGLTDLSHASAYLADEYLLDVALRMCSKPVFAWGDGYIMGGGMGVFQGADVRFVTEHSSLAMPEVRIGFVPDCGGSWFLQRVPHGLGVCLSMSGATVSAGDACWLNLADWVMPRVEKETVYASILALPFAHKETALAALGTQLAEATLAAQPGPWEEHGLAVSHAIRHQTPRGVWSVMNQWHQQVPELCAGLELVSPGACVLAGCQFQRARYVSLVDAVIQEHDIGMQILTDGEWCEGVRALLIDKDKNPQWRFATLDAVTDDWIHAMLAPMPWAAGHPLKHRLQAQGYLDGSQQI